MMKQTYILVHGAWHGAWCWERVAPELTAAGHCVVALDMPCMGDDRTPIADSTIDRAVARIVQAIEQAESPVILVGHSMGGLAITLAAEVLPRKIAKLVYLTAYLPSNGESCLSLAMADHSTVPYGMQFSEDRTFATMRDEWIKPSLYNDCSDGDVAHAKSRLRPQPLESYAHVASISAERAGTVPRIFIECLRDHAITPGFQRKMYLQNPCKSVLTLDTGHSPFFSAPLELASHLLSLA
jgi:pimeloyl-ACP methyl ester carboxylesterase